MPARLSRHKLANKVAADIKAGDNLAMKRLAAYLVETGRQKEAELIVRDIEQALVAHGLVLADVTSARPLSSEAKDAIEAFIKSDTSAERVILRESVDTGLIGGVRVSYGDRLLDATVATKLERLA